MSQTSTCALWEERRQSSQDKEPKLRLSLETRVTDDFTVICCKGRIAYGIEAAALSGEIAELGPQTRRVVIDLSGVEMIDAAGLANSFPLRWQRKPAGALSRWLLPTISSVTCW